ncbi:hypothetical protein GIB67_019749 [Kingdonia uniflora]|uniref:Uncharacterized protein n=1 Tax=Kingdonia uniflora TaxID=39325 RepID=A0A7J7MK12_9MAGN|nr:hypothetical protein GIB67_019749 [Kingdonia uniflora]
MRRAKRPEDSVPILASSGASKRSKTTRGTRTGPSRANPLGSRRGGASGSGGSCAGTRDNDAGNHDMIPNPLNWSAFKLRKYQKEDTINDKSFRVSIDGFELHISSDDIRHAFGLCEPVSPNASFFEWPPVLDRFPPKWEIEEELLFTGKKKARQAVGPSTSRPATTSMPDVPAAASPGVIPHDLASMITSMQSCLGRLKSSVGMLVTHFDMIDTQLESRFQSFKTDIDRLQASVDALSSRERGSPSEPPAVDTVEGS